MVFCPICTATGGEDLEGEYWGVVVKLPRCAVEKIYGRDPIEAGYAMQETFINRILTRQAAIWAVFFPDRPDKRGPFWIGFFWHNAVCQLLMKTERRNDMNIQEQIAANRDFCKVLFAKERELSDQQKTAAAAAFVQTRPV